MRTSLLIAVLGTLAVGCIGPEDNPTMVTDLRVLGVSLSPPEVMAETCAINPTTLATFSAPLEYTALVADPAGQGRKVRFELFACAWPGDRDCSTLEDRVRIYPTGGAPMVEADSGEIKVTIAPGTAFLDERQQFLLQQVFEQDTYKGLGGLRMPIVLHVQAGEEEIYASKLMVFSCRLFPDQAQNNQPVLPGLRFIGEPWAENEVKQLTGSGPFEITPENFANLEESYVVPSLELQPVHLVEAWKISWMATYGRFSSSETGGADIGGGEGRHRVEWAPPAENRVETDFTVYAVVRDGRGGLSWLTRRAHYKP